MVSIHTNLSSLIAQGSLTKSTNTLNRAIEQMSTGYKINHASDNAANYSIKTNMDTKIGAYEVAAENVAMGIDLVTTASDIVSQMQNKGERLRSLCVQARNGTYGTQSLEAINSEANALVSEINRLYITSEYNGISLFNRTAYTIPTHLQVGSSGFLDETPFVSMTGADSTSKVENNDFIVEPEIKNVDHLNSVSSIDSAEGFTESEYKITEVEDLVALRSLVAAGLDTTGVTFIMANDIDLGAYCDAEIAIGPNGPCGWSPIGSFPTKTFNGIFDGNGYVIKNLKIDARREYVALFGATGKFSQIKNLGLVGGFVKGGNKRVGALVAYAQGTISNCFSSMNVSGTNEVGGLVGAAMGTAISNCYATGDVSATGYTVGGLVGSASCAISNSYATGNVSGTNKVGGLVGSASCAISNSYATGNVSGTNQVGGLVGGSYSDTINNCYATGDVSGDESVGGLVGELRGSISNSFASGVVSGNSFVGGLVGQVYKTSGVATVSDCASYSKVLGNSLESTASFIGGIALTYEGTSYGAFNTTNNLAFDSMNTIGGLFKSDDYSLIDYDNSTMLAGIDAIDFQETTTSLLVGTSGNSSSRLVFDANFVLDIDSIGVDISSDLALTSIDGFMKKLSEQETMFGVVQNRLESALDSIMVNIENLVSSLSTIQDADMSEVSATYIQQQILQQASATLMATANQTPAIALQLL